MKLHRSFYTLLLAGLFFVGCSESKKTKDGHLIYPEQTKEILDTNNYDKQIVLKSIEYIKLSEDYTPETFEAKQKQAIEEMTSTYRKAAMEYLPTRVREVVETRRSNSVTLDKESSKLKKVPYGDLIRAQVKIEGDGVMIIEGKEHKNRMEYILNILIYNMDDFQYETLGGKECRLMVDFLRIIAI